MMKALLYSLSQNALGARALRRYWAARFIKAGAGERLLDLGCGTGDILECLPSLEYLGIDREPSFIAFAERRWKGRRFLRGDFLEENPDIPQHYYDIILAGGVLHHLNDREVLNLLTKAKGYLKPGGRFLSFDGCFHASQSTLSRFFVSKDFGGNARPKEKYLALASSVFEEVNSEAADNLLRIPYAHFFMVLKKSGGISE